MSHASGLAHSTQSVPGPAPTPVANEQHPIWHPYRQNLMPTARPSSILEKHADLSSGHGSAKRTDRRGRASPPLHVNRIRNARPEAAHATVSSVTPGLTRSEFEFCRQSLSTVFQKCTDIDFLQLSVIISCLLTCLQTLHVTEISAILTLLLGRESGDQDRSERTEDTVLKRLQAKCSQVFFQDSAGFLHFSHPLIPKFLLAYPVKGIDRSHTVLAKACTTQLDFDGGIREFGITGIEATWPRTGAFSGYAAENWQEHYRRAEKGTPSLTAQVHRMLWTEVMKRSACANCGTSDGDLSRDAVNEALDFCITRNFQILSRSYNRLLVGMDSASCSRDNEESDRTFPESSARVPDLDQAMEELQLTESDSESDGSSDSDSDSSWSLV